MSKIITITLNTAVDNITEIKNFKIGKVEKAISNLYQSGKGINVARAISALNKKVTALGFVGQKELDFFNELNSEKIQIALNPVNGNTRMNITLLDQNHRLIIHTRSTGYRLKKEDIENIIKIADKTIDKNDVVIISGSIPNKEIIFGCQRLIKLGVVKGARVIFDSSGKELLEGIKAIPYVIKPNLDELQEITKRKIRSEKEIVIAAKQLNKKGIEFVFVSSGSKGIIATVKNYSGYWKAHLSEKIIKITGSEIGCGDAAVAGIAVSILENKNIEEMLRLAISTATANLFAKVPGQCENRMIKKFDKKVIIEKINRF